MSARNVEKNLRLFCSEMNSLCALRAVRQTLAKRCQASVFPSDTSSKLLQRAEVQAVPVAVLRTVHPATDRTRTDALSYGLRP